MDIEQEGKGEAKEVDQENVILKNTVNKHVRLNMQRKVELTQMRGN